MNPAASTAPGSSLGEQIATDAYLRIRQRPRRRDGDYLCLVDVHRVVLRHVGEMRGDLYDYGCGGAPYADLLRGARSYVKADIVPGPNVDRLLGADGLTGEADAAYDWVFSTQVLEHVPEPARYLAECLRILRPGGQLLLTTHGFYPEHGCPYDFHRWTAEGLLREVRAAGFEVVEGGKLTTGIRGALQLAHHCVWGLRPPAGSLWGPWLGAFRKAYGWLAVPVLNWFGDRFPEQSVVPAEDPARWYVGIHVRARKPGA